MTDSTEIEIPDIPAPVGRPRINYEKTMARFRKGTFARIAAALKEGEQKSDFIRQAVENELQRRETSDSQ